MRLSEENLLAEYSHHLSDLTALAHSACLAMATMIGGVVLLAWLFPAAGTTLPPGWSLMHANTALCVLLSALSLATLSSDSLWSQRLSLTAALACILFAGSGLLFHTTGHAQPAASSQPSMPHQMSLQTSVFFTTLGFTLLILIRQASSRYLPDILNLILLMFCIFLFSGYLFKAQTLYGQSDLIRTSPHTLASMFLLVFALYFNRRNPRFRSLFVQTDISGHIARRALLSAIILPLLIITLGVYAVQGNVLSMQYSASLTTTLTCAMMLVTVYLMVLKIRTLEMNLKRNAVMDELTKLYNLKGFFILSEKIMELSERQSGNICLLYFDLDGLKAVNDSRGHEAGSEMIRQFSQLVSVSFRSSDIIARVGGDEFVALCVDEHPDKPLARLDMVIAHANASGRNPFTLNYSCGWHCSTPSERQTIQQLMDIADHNMYRNKRQKKEQLSS